MQLAKDNAIRIDIRYEAYIHASVTALTGQQFASHSHMTRDPPGMYRLL